jgi:hypothetical protein
MVTALPVANSHGEGRLPWFLLSRSADDGGGGIEVVGRRSCSFGLLATFQRKVVIKGLLLSIYLTRKAYQWPLMAATTSARLAPKIKCCFINFARITE